MIKDETGKLRARKKLKMVKGDTRKRRPWKTLKSWFTKRKEIEDHEKYVEHG